MARLTGPAFVFEGLPTAWRVLFGIALVVVCAMFVWTFLLFVRGGWSRRHPPDPVDPDDWLWVFLVPALNEEVTICDSVERLLAVQCAHRRIVVIDDGSDDGTAERVAAIGHPDLHVLHRDLPDARLGKAAALNGAYRHLDGLLDGWSRDRVIVVVVDADGRLHPDSPRFAAAHFCDPVVGGVQSLVRIYNRGHLLTWFQDVEFSVYGCLYQSGRNAWGTAGMGGNGQFNRVAALDAVCDHEGPWRDRLTEDQDLGLRLLGAGWAGRQDLRAVVDQQGLSSLRALYRQRTRWAQGNLQAMDHVREVWRAHVTRVARVEQLAYLLIPIWQAFIGVTLIVALVLAFTGEAAFWGDGPWWQLVFFYLLGFGGVIMGCISRGAHRGWRGILGGVAVAQVYAFYTWLLWPVLLRAGVRQLVDRRDWAKTQREPIGLPAPGADT